jgi:hypothetical protein
MAKGGLFGSKHVPPVARDPRPKGTQRGVARRDNQGASQHWRWLVPQS